MSYEVQVVADSVAPHGGRITTFQLRYPRMVHAELMTHRLFSRNASSTRAIPTARMIEWIERDPAMPVYWGKNQKGMQATEELGDDEVDKANRQWILARDLAIERAKALMEIGVHKQIASRILEPWAHINVIATATSFDNFFALRCDRMAMPEIQALAVRMAAAYRDSDPVRRPNGDFGSAWHLPYVTDEERSDCPIEDQLKFSVARCARVSYLTFEGQAPDRQKDSDLHDRLAGNGHWSPFEHPACVNGAGVRSGNFVGWSQYRQQLPVQCHERFDFTKLDEYGDSEFIV